MIKGHGFLISFLMLSLTFLTTQSYAQSSSKNMRIAVIGAGASGLTAAYSLKKRGYRNITVYEADGRVGGKVQTIKVDGKPYELGAVWQMNNYRTVLSLAKELHIPIKANKRKILQVDADGQLRSGFESAIKKYNAFNVGKAFIKYKTLVSTKYRGIYREGFANLPQALHQPFSAFVKKHKLEPMADAVKGLLIACGYGYYEEVPAMYYMKLINMVVDGGIAHAALGPLPWNKPVALYAPKGYQGIWDAVASQLNVRLNSPVEAVSRQMIGNDPTIKITSRGKTETFDRLIVSTPIDLTKNFMPLTGDEQRLASKVQNYNYVISLFKGQGLPRQQSTIFMKHTAPDTIGHVLAIDSEWASKNIWVAYQQLPQNASPALAVPMLVKDIEAAGGKVEQVIQQKAWTYFPHVKTKEIQDGFYDKIEALQGQNGTYYVGGLMSFETVENAASYAKHLAQKRFH